MNCSTWHRVLRNALVPLAWVVVALPALAVEPEPVNTVYLEEMTSPELRQRIAAGTTTILVPVGGTEQNGPHLVLGKHNVRVRLLAGQIARRLGNAVVAPVMAYVPEGSIHPPAAHMRFAGTISIAEPAFESVLDGAARSLRQHGFRDIVFLGDHGGYQKSLARVAQRLNREWASEGLYRVQALTEYYDAAQTTYNATLKAKGFSTGEIGTHAGLADTSLALAVEPALVRSAQLAQAAKGAPANGVAGDPRRATPEAGQFGVQGIVDASVAAIHAAIQTRAAH